METGVARTDVDLESYVEELEARLGKSREMMRVVLNKAKNDPKRVVLAEGDDEKMIRAAAQIVDQGIAEPVLIGDRDRITAIAETLGLDFAPRSSTRRRATWRSTPTGCTNSGSARASRATRPVTSSKTATTSGA